ncbi:MAG: gliding motility-associated C-terminal domain-containing protein [Bacteroidales bacterium]|nr:gliding motility-associated C-terminal domain-containing protein [Bacteroidales bacterium]
MRYILLFVFMAFYSVTAGQEVVNKMLSLKLAQITDYEHLIFDYNGDQKVDVLVFAKSRDSIDFYRNEGEAMIYDFSIQVHAFSNSYFHTYYGDEIHFYYQDADKDGNNDLLVYSANHWNCGENSVRIYWGNALTWFRSEDFAELPMNNPFCVGSIFVDFDNDGQTDVFIRSASGTNTMLRNEGNRVFTPVPTFPTGRDINMFLSDMDGDGFKDLIYGKNGWADGQWGFRFNKGIGNGDFDPSTQVYFQDERVSDWNVVSISLNPLEDNVLDFAFLASNDGTNQHRLYKAFWDDNTGSFRFSTLEIDNEGVETELISPVDYNGDGSTDLVYRYRQGPEPPFRYTGCVLLNDGYGNFYKTDTIIKNSLYKPYFFRPDPDHRFYMGLLRDKGTSNYWEIDSLYVVRIDKFYSINDSVSVSDNQVTYTEKAMVKIENHHELKALDKITSMEFNLRYDTQIAEFDDYNLEGSIAGEAALVEITQSQPGYLNIRCTTQEPVSGKGVLINLGFNSLKPGFCELLISDFLYNQDTIQNLKNGSITIDFQAIQAMITIGDTITDPGNSVVMPVVSQWPLAENQRIQAISFNLEYDPQIVTYSTYGTEGTIAAGAYTLITELSPGTLNISMNSEFPVSGSGPLLNLSFLANEKGISPLVLSEVVFNFDTIRNIDNGSIEVVSRVVSLSIPSSFTPNSDGINDYFEFVAEGIVAYTVWIRDSWGREVFAYDMSTAKWGGETNSGKEASAGSYYYNVIATDYSGTELQRSGVVYLIRDLIDLSPNPAKDKLVIKMNGRLPGERSLRIFSANGMLVLNQLVPDQNELVLDISKMNSGFYLLVISNGTVSQSVSFIKE